jgi:transcriptional regulator with XRE-family HTH domain
MLLHEKIVSARNKKGITQEELANLTDVTVRTIQRIERGESVPRKFTLKTISTALDISFDELNSTENKEAASSSSKNDSSSEDETYFLQLFCLSCFTYIFIPFVHFLIPSYLLKRRQEKDPAVIAFARKVLRGQIYWVITTHLLMLLALSYNMIFFAADPVNIPFVSYFIPFIFMYTVNIVIILMAFSQIRNRDLVRKNAV